MEGFMARFPSPRRAALVILLAVAAFAVAVAGCSKDRGTPLAPTAQTLGSLVHKGTTQYVLSNYHVLESDIVSGGNNRVAQVGDPVVQPGLIDVNCTAANAQNVASLSGIKSLPSSNVDCAIASTISGQV